MGRLPEGPVLAAVKRHVVEMEKTEKSKQSEKASRVCIFLLTEISERVIAIPLNGALLQIIPISSTNPFL